MKLVPSKTEVADLHDYPFHTWSAKTKPQCDGKVIRFPNCPVSAAA